MKAIETHWLQYWDRSEDKDMSLAFVLLPSIYECKTRSNWRWHWINIGNLIRLSVFPLFYFVSCFPISLSFKALSINTALRCFKIRATNHGRVWLMAVVRGCRYMSGVISEKLKLNKYFIAILQKYHAQHIGLKKYSVKKNLNPFSPPSTTQKHPSPPRITCEKQRSENFIKRCWRKLNENFFGASFLVRRVAKKGHRFDKSCHRPWTEYSLSVIIFLLKLTLTTTIAQRSHVLKNY